jgi:nucleoside 2-deoxyribosyltransferase
MTSQVRDLRTPRRPPRDVHAADELADDIAARVLAILDGRKVGSLTAEPAPGSTLVFVICSFEPQMEPVYAAIAAAARAVGLHAERVKDVQGDYRVTETILGMIRQARLVVADLTFERPNVYFELGYARGLGKTVITLLRAGATAHFDVRDWTYLEYIDSRPLETDLLERMRYELRSQGWPETAKHDGAGLGERERRARQRARDLLENAPRAVARL